jgi:hypothetical protein
MRPSRAVLPAAAALACAAALPSSALGGSWTAPRAATSAGEAFGPVVAADARGRIAVGFGRALGDVRRAEVRRGTLRSGLQGGSLVLDSFDGNLDGVVVGLTGNSSRLAVAWRRRANAAQRLRAATVSLGGTVTGPVDLTPDGTESAFFPRFGTGADGVLRLFWDRRTTSAGRAVQGAAFGPRFAVPAPGVGANPAVAVDPDGTMVAVWTRNGQLLTASAPAGGVFGPVTALEAGGYAREAQAVVTDGGDVVAAWLASSGEGNAVRVAVRPRGGAFAAAFEVAGRDQGAFAPRLAATSAGEVMVAWVNTASRRGWGNARGVIRAQRLGGDERPVGSRVRLSPDGARALQPALVHDGTGSILAAWTDSANRRRVQARRIAPGAITGPVRTLSRAPAANTLAPELAGAAGQGVAAWLQDGDVVVSRYR